jgi:hypothetical protein
MMMLFNNDMLNFSDNLTNVFNLYDICVYKLTVSQL